MTEQGAKVNTLKAARDAIALIEEALAEPSNGRKQAMNINDWVLVPREPTEAMVNAGIKRRHDRLMALRDGVVIEQGGVAEAVANDWNAMLAAAPQPDLIAPKTAEAGEAVEEVRCWLAEADVHRCECGCQRIDCGACGTNIFNAAPEHLQNAARTLDELKENVPPGVIPPHALANPAPDRLRGLVPKMQIDAAELREDENEAAAMALEEYADELSAALHPDTLGGKGEA